MKKRNFLLFSEYFMLLNFSENIGISLTSRRESTNDINGKNQKLSKITTVPGFKEA